MTVTKAYDDGAQIQSASEDVVMRYDGLGRRISKQVTNSADLDCTHYYYHDGQKTIETRDESDDVLKHYVWGISYIDELVRIDISADPSANDTTTDNNDYAYYALHDANYNVLAVVDDEGTLVERYEYTPYGERTVYISSGDNDPDCYSPVYMSQQIPDTTQSPTVPNPYGICEIGHQGLMHDEELGLIYNRARMLHPRLGRFMQRDPLGYVDGMSLYLYLRSSIFGFVDSSGLGSYKIRVGKWRPPDPNADAIARSKSLYGMWRNLQNDYRSFISEQRFRVDTAVKNHLKYPQTARGLRHFASNTGKTLRIDLKTFIRQDRRALAHFIREVNDVVQHIETNHESIAANGGRIVTEDNSTDRFASHNDWHSLLGSRYHTWASAKNIKCVGDTYSATWVFHLRDLFNWNIHGKLAISLPVPDFIPVEGGKIDLVRDRDMAMLHRLGVMQEFNVRGKLRINLKWKKGERLPRDWEPHSGVLSSITKIIDALDGLPRMAEP